MNAFVSSFGAIVFTLIEGSFRFTITKEDVLQLKTQAHAGSAISLLLLLLSFYSRAVVGSAVLVICRLLILTPMISTSNCKFEFGIDKFDRIFASRFIERQSYWRMQLSVPSWRYFNQTYSERSPDFHHKQILNSHQWWTSAKCITLITSLASGERKNASEDHGRSVPSFFQEFEESTDEFPCELKCQTRPQPLIMCCNRPYSVYGATDRDGRVGEAAAREFFSGFNRQANFWNFSLSGLAYS